MKTLDQVDAISTKDRQLLTEIKDIVHQYEPGATVLLYGSVARGTHTPESDYDILVLTDTELGREHHKEISDALFDWELEAGIVVSTLYHVKSEWNRPRDWIPPFHREVQRDGVIL